MITGIVSLSIYENEEGTQTYATMEVNRHLCGPYAIHIDGCAYSEFQPTLEGLKECHLGADGVGASFRMGDMFPMVTIRKEGHQDLTFVIPWNHRIEFSLLTPEEYEEESWKIACHSEQMSEFHAERAFCQG